MGFFWGCNCCGVDYFLVTHTYLVGRKFDQVTDVFRVSHGQDIKGNGIRLPMVADASHVWIPRNTTTSPHTDGIFKFAIDGSFVTSFNANGNTTNSQHFNGLALSPTGTFGGGGLFNTSTARIRAFQDGGTGLWDADPAGTGLGGKCAFDADGNLYAIYSISSVTRIGKYDSSGSLVWISTSTGIGTDTYTSISVDLDGNVLVGASAASSSDRTLAKYDPDGAEIWSITRTTLGYNVSAIAVTPNNDIVVAGNNGGSFPDGIAKKYDTNGTELEADTYADLPLLNVACDHQGRVVFCGRGLTVGTGVAFTYDDSWNALQSTSDGAEEFDGCCVVGGLVTEWNP